MATGVQQAKSKCSKCSAEFNSAEELRLHEQNCTGKRDAKSGTKENRTDAKTDMEIEDRFEATDN